MRKERKKRLRRIGERARRRRTERIRETVTGKLTMTGSGYGFVAPESIGENGKKPEDIFIPPQFVNGALDGDTVRVSLLPPREDSNDEHRGPAGSRAKPEHGMLRPPPPSSPPAGSFPGTHSCE